MNNDHVASDMLNLSDLINEIQRQLVQAQKNRIADGIGKFVYLKEFELELKYTVVKRKDETGKFDLKIISFGDNTKIAAQQCHTIRVKYESPQKSMRNPNQCPECGEELTRSDEATTCSNCGYTRCD